MKTAISLPDTVFAEAEHFARQRKTTRSQLYADALREYLDRHARTDVTTAMNKACDLVHDRDPGFIHAAARKILSKETW
jgi:metal-responsive CopG/Arc/MetJ family transcriptional regulator